MARIEDLVSLSEYASIHGMPTDTVKSARRQGRFKSAVKIGRNWCVDKNEILTDKRVKSGKYINWRKGDVNMKARVYGNMDVCGKIKNFKVVEELPEDAVKVKLDPKQDTGDDDEQMYYTFYYSEKDGYICIQTSEKETDIEADTIEEINEIKAAGGSPLDLAKEINEIYGRYKERMEKSGYDEYTIEIVWDSIKDECDMM